MFKNIVVHLSGSAEDDTRLAYATQLAETFTAHLTGAFVHEMPESIAFPEPTATTVIRELWDESSKQADAVAETLVTRLAGLSVAHEIRRFDAPPGQTGAMLAAECRTADLFVGTRPPAATGSEARTAEAVLLGSGRGCLFVPPDGTPPTAYATCLVAWNASRESARAMAEAMPILQQAEKVVVAIVEEHGASEQFHMEAGADVGRYMSRHDITAEVRTIAGWSDAGEAIANEAKMVGADLIVMGGYGHSRLREWVLGGATRHMLTESAVPVLMAH